MSDYDSLKIYVCAVQLLRKILIPLVPVYYVVTWMRNKMYDFGFIKSVSFDLPIICVGNLSVGGTGKTPMIEYLIELLKNDFKMATLSRGYKRKTKGFQLANSNSSAETLGDEPYQFYNKFQNSIQVAVDTDRVHGIQKILQPSNPPEIILLDDAFQHRKVKAGLNILLTTYENLYTNDFVLPTGNLREPKRGAHRAHIIVVTKCPSLLSELEKAEIIEQIKPDKHQSVFFSNISYSSILKSCSNSKKLEDLNEFTLVTGIANPKPLVNFLKNKNQKFEHLNFKDHHEFTKKDVSELSKKKFIITTEKDYVRLQIHEDLKDKLYYLPIKMNLSDDLKFNELIERFVEIKQ